jgi:hypothetical protein
VTPGKLGWYGYHVFRGNCSNHGFEITHDFGLVNWGLVLMAGNIGWKPRPLFAGKAKNPKLWLRAFGDECSRVGYSAAR